MTEPFIPVRMLAEYVYCPRLAYMLWVQGELPNPAETACGTVPETDRIHTRTVSLSSGSLGISALIDVVEDACRAVRPVTYKKGKRPHVAAGAYESDRVLLCAQGLLLREQGFSCDNGLICFMGAKEQVKIRFDPELVNATVNVIQALRDLSLTDTPPLPLAESPKCAACDLIGICLPDEMGLLTHQMSQVRPVYPKVESAFPLYVQSSASYVKKSGEQLIIEEKRQKVAEVRLMDISQVVLFGHCSISSPALQACFRRDIPVTFMSYGGWFLGHSTGTGHRNVLARTAQYRSSFSAPVCLSLARQWIHSKIHNCRVLMRRNWKAGDGKMPEPIFAAMKSDARQAFQAESLESLLGVEGNAARRYFENFMSVIAPEKRSSGGFDFTCRNRRPPRDPINALLSFAYAMLTREWTVTLSAVGLDPYRGFLHQARFGLPALTLDMMEPFRPLVADSTVITVINNGEIKETDFVYGAGACNLTPDGRKRFIAAFERRLSHEVTHPIFKYKISYRRLFEVQARLLIRHLTGEISNYPDFLTR